jgi:general secretion pathway protein K
MRGSNRRTKPNGFVVVAALWMVAALSVLAAVYAVFVANAATTFGMTSERLQAETLITAGLELAAYQLRSAPRARAAVGANDFRLGRATVRTRFQAENGRIDLNAAPPALLSGLFVALGAPSQAANDYADRIVAWRAPRPDGGGDEAALYRAAGRGYAPRQAPFPHVGEIWLVLGLPEPLVARALPFLTVYSGKPAVNMIAAAPEVIAGLPGMTPESANAVLSARETADPPQLTALLGPAAQYANAEVGNTFRINVDVALDTGRLARAEIVVLVDDQDTQPYRVLSWRDMSDRPLSEARR